MLRHLFVLIMFFTATPILFGADDQGISSVEARVNFKEYAKTMSSCQSALIILGEYNFSSSKEKLAFIQSIKKRIESDHPSSECAQYFLSIGVLYRDSEMFNHAIEAFLVSKLIIEQLNLTTKRVYADLCDAMGHIYYSVGDYPRSLDYFMMWNANPNKSDEYEFNVLNTIGLVYLRLNELDEAENYFQRAIENAKSKENWSWVGIVSGNLSGIYHQRGQHEEALKLAEIDYQLSLEYGNYGSAGLVLVNRAKYLIQQNRLQDAQICLSEAHDHLMREPEFKFFPPEFYEVRGELYHRMGNYKDALNDLKRSQEIRDSILMSRDKTQLQNIEYRIFAQKKEAEIESLIEQRKKNVRYIWIISFVGVIFITLLLLLARQLNIKRLKDREIQSVRRELLTNKLIHAEDNISQLLNGIKNRNSFIQKLSVELEKAKYGNKIDVKSGERIAKTLRERKILTEDDWVRFKNLFSEIYPSFFEALIERTPSLTPAELRMAALIRLNLTNQEMANLLGISKDSVRKTILRLRNKMNIDSNDQLIQYLFSQ